VPELREAFALDDILRWGCLPTIYSLANDAAKNSYLRAYTHTYLKEEIAAEQITRRLDPFREFLEVAAQANGTIVNYANIARDVGVDSKTVVSYFQILEDTLIGFHLPAYHRSVRKQQRANPKFYFFDLGVKRALDRTLELPLRGGTYEYGKAFEHFVVTQIAHLARYRPPDWRLFHLRTGAGADGSKPQFYSPGYVYYQGRQSRWRCGVQAWVGGAMAGRNDEAYWKANIRLVLSLLAAWFLVSFGAGILLVDALDNIRFAGFKLGFWMAQQGSIFVFIILIFVYIRRMDQLDARYRRSGDAGEDAAQ